MAKRKKNYKRGKDRKIRNYKYLAEYLETHPCVDCGITDLVVLQFDHVRGVKSNNVTTLAYKGAGLDRIKKEIAKCDIRCANCHVRRTAKVGGWSRSKID